MTTSRSVQHRPLALRPQNIPLFLQVLPRWIVWRGKRKPGTAKLSKLPGHWAHPGMTWSIKDNSCWTTFEQVVATCQRHPDQWSGIGLVLTGIDSLVAIDLDHCSDLAGAPNAFARDILLRARAEGAYMERSPSGTGFRIFMSAHESDPDWTNSDVGIEVYRGSGTRYVTVTGHVLEDL